MGHSARPRRDPRLRQRRGDQHRDLDATGAAPGDDLELRAAAQEAEFPRDAHRHTNTDRAGYLQHLPGPGYVLSDVEQLIADNVKPNEENTVSPADLEQPEEVTPDNLA